MLHYHILAILLFSFWSQANPAFGRASWIEISYGRKTAPVKIIEYAAPTCSVCGEFSKTVFPELGPYIEAGKVQFVSRHLPYNDIDLKASVLIEKSPHREKFNTFVYQNQERWLFSKRPIQSLIKLLEQEGMSRPLIKKALRNKGLEDRLIQERLLSEKKYGIEVIPMIIVGKKKIRGLIPWKDLKIIIDQALEHVNQGNPMESFGENDEENKILRRKTQKAQRKTSAHLPLISTRPVF